jgi:hypothetical protein
MDQSLYIIGNLTAIPLPTGSHRLTLETGGVCVVGVPTLNQHPTASLRMLVKSSHFRDSYSVRRLDRCEVTDFYLIHPRLSTVSSANMHTNKSYNEHEATITPKSYPSLLCIFRRIHLAVWPCYTPLGPLFFPWPNKRYKSVAPKVRTTMSERVLQHIKENIQDNHDAYVAMGRVDPKSDDDSR